MDEIFHLKTLIISDLFRLNKLILLAHFFLKK